MKPKQCNREAHITDFDIANERTFLAYLRTSSAFAALGTTIRQLFLLTKSDGSTSNATSPYGEASAVACMVLAAIVALSGAFRFWRQQNAMARAKVHASGWDVYIVGLAGLAVRATNIQAESVC